MTFDVKPGAESWIEVDRVVRSYRVAAGVRWSEVIQALDPLGFLPRGHAVEPRLQRCRHLDVNAHGWPVPFGPFGSTVRAVRLMLADGTIVSCSRTDNADLFSLVVGGYGLLGIILDVEVEMVANVLLVPTFERVSAAEVGARLMTTVQDAAVSMAYGRLSIAAKGFLEEALVVSYRPVLPQPRALPLATRSNVYSFLSRRDLSEPDRLRARQGGALVRRDRGVFARGGASAADAQRHPQLSGRGAGRDQSEPHRYSP